MSQLDHPVREAAYGLVFPCQDVPSTGAVGDQVVPHQLGQSDGGIEITDTRRRAAAQLIEKVPAQLGGRGGTTAPRIDRLDLLEEVVLVHERDGTQLHRQRVTSDR